MIQPCQDDGTICLYVFTHYNYYILKYRIDLWDCIFSSLKLSCKKDLVLPWNVLPLIVIQSQITNKAQSCFSLKANDPTSLSCSWQNHTVKYIWDMRWWEETGALTLFTIRIEVWHSKLPSGTTYPSLLNIYRACVPVPFQALECICYVPVEVLGRWHKHAPPQYPSISEQLVHITL